MCIARMHIDSTKKTSQSYSLKELAPGMCIARMHIDVMKKKGKRHSTIII
jgi:hypothetical protein